MSGCPDHGLMRIEMTRGERNNNPGNIERNATKWQGMAKDQSGDSRFVIFTDPVYGIRALAKCLMTYSKKFDGTAHDIDTVGEVISRWAPSTENNTKAYVNAVAKALNVSPDDPIDMEDPITLEGLVRAIIKHENGRCVYDDATIVDAIDRAVA